MDIRRYHNIMEKIWLFIGFITAAIVVFIISKEGLEGNYLLLLLPIMAFIMFFFRKLLSKKSQENNNKL